MNGRSSGNGKDTQHYPKRHGRIDEPFDWCDWLYCENYFYADIWTFYGAMIAMGYLSGWYGNDRLDIWNGSIFQ
jgi:hypothetical protein